MQIRIFYLFLLHLLFTPFLLWGAPAISGVTGTLTHGQSVTISGSGFGTKTAAAPVAFDNLSQQTTGQAVSNTATVGAWTDTGDLTTSETVVRHANGTKSGYCNINAEKSARFQGGTDSPTWFVQYWLYLGSNWAFNSSYTSSLGNIKIFRMWTTGSGSNTFAFATSGTWDIYGTDEAVDQTHNWNPVLSGYEWVDEVLGHGDKSYSDNGVIGWHEFENDITKEAWHQLKFEFKYGSTSAADGIVKVWFDGKQIIGISNLISRTAAQSAYGRPQTVGFYNSHSTGGTNSDFYITDAYIDNTWSRVEIGDASTYAACTHTEIQPATAWAAGELTVTLNQGSFSDDATAYVYVVDADGAVNSSGYEITLGGSSTLSTSSGVSGSGVSRQ